MQCNTIVQVQRVKNLDLITVCNYNQLHYTVLTLQKLKQEPLIILCSYQFDLFLIKLLTSFFLIKS